MINLGEKGRTYALFVVVALACALGALTQTVMNPMLEGVRADFGVDATVSQWLTTIYMLVLGITVPVVTFLSQKFSMRNLVFLTLGFFLAGGIVDVFAPNFGVLIAGRVLQAVAAGITVPLLQSIAMTRFPPGQNATAMGIAGIAMGFAPNIGPLIGGALVDSFGWRSFFVILVAFVVVLALACALLIERGVAPARDASLDMASFVLSTLGFGGLLLGFSNASSVGAASLATWVPVALGAVCLVLFVRRQRRIERPLISMRIFGFSTFRVSFVLQNCLFASYMGIILVIPLYLQGLCGASALEAGIVFVPSTILAVFVNPLAGILSDKLGARPVIVGASVFLAAGAISMVFVDADTPLWVVSLMQTVRGIGVSALIGPLTSWGMSGLAHEVMMDGSAFFACVRQACASFGTAIMVLIITLVAASVPGALGYQLAFGFSAVFAVCVLAGSLWKVR